MPWTPLTSHLTCRLDESAGRCVIRLAGELDLVSAGPLQQLLRQALADEGRIVLDLSRLTFIDARGVALLVRVHRHALDIGGRLTLRRPHETVRRMMELVGLTDLFDVESPLRWLALSDVAAVLGEALDGAMRIARAPLADAQLASAAGDLQIVAHRGFSGAFLDFFGVVDGDDSACAIAMARGRPVWVEEVDRSPIFRGTPAGQVLKDAGANAVASIPISVPGGVVGMISVHRPARTAWSADQRWQLAEHARLAGTVLDDCRIAG